METYPFRVANSPMNEFSSGSVSRLLKSRICIVSLPIKRVISIKTKSVLIPKILDFRFSFFDTIAKLK